jgi:hypothetical protein
MFSLCFEFDGTNENGQYWKAYKRNWEAFMKGQKQSSELDDERLWGARAIGEAIDLTPGAAQNLLGRGLIRGARRVGLKWTITRAELRQTFKPEATV